MRTGSGLNLNANLLAWVLEDSHFPPRRQQGTKSCGIKQVCLSPHPCPIKACCIGTELLNL